MDGVRSILGENSPAHLCITGPRYRFAGTGVRYDEDDDTSPKELERELGYPWAVIVAVFQEAGVRIRKTGGRNVINYDDAMEAWATYGPPHDEDFMTPRDATRILYDRTEGLVPAWSLRGVHLYRSGDVYALHHKIQVRQLTDQEKARAERAKASIARQEAVRARRKITEHRIGQFTFVPEIRERPKVIAIKVYHKSPRTIAWDDASARGLISSTEYMAIAGISRNGLLKRIKTGRVVPAEVIFGTYWFTADQPLMAIVKVRHGKEA